MPLSTPLRQGFAAPYLLLVVALSMGGCLPTVVAPGDAGAADVGPLDAGPFRAGALRVEGYDGLAHSPAAAPRSPRLRITLSARPDVDSLEDAVLVLPGDADDALLEDLERPPLRSSTLAGALPALVHIEGRDLVLEPSPRAPGETLTVVVASWVRAEHGGRLEASVVESLTIGADPRLGARATEAWPPDGAATVPPGLSRLVVRFDGLVDPGRGVLELFDERGPLGATVADIDCAQVGWSEGVCLEARVDAPLAAGEAYRLAVGAAARDHTGADVPAWQARFTTSQSPDVSPPRRLPLTCALDEASVDGVGCLRVSDDEATLRVLVDEPALLELRGGERSAVEVSARGDGQLTLRDLGPGVAFDAELRAVDLAGRSAVVTVPIETARDLATLSITEVRADPNGGEPHQEFVEVLNYGAVPIPLAGVALADRPDSVGDVIETPLALAPGQRALLVADSFDPNDPDDAQPPAGALLVRIGSSLASGGLRNAGEALYLRDAQSRRLSAAPSTAVAEGRCLVRTSPSPRSAERAAFEERPCTPGAPP